MLLIMKNKKRKRDPKYKQLSFETAIRNPERYKGILEYMQDYQGIVLNDENLLTIVSGMYENGIVTSPDFDLSKYSTKEEIYNSVISINSTRKADGGFPKGYQSRFWTYMRTLSEFGFVYARYNKPFKIGDVGLKFIENKIDAQEAFSIQAIKYNRRSPYKNVLNDFNYFRFIIKVLKKLDSENKELSYNQFIISLFSEDGNVDEFIKIIKNNKFPTPDSVYSYLEKIYGKINKKSTVLGDYPDVVLRMLRITGYVNILNKGITLIELNQRNLNYINSLLKLDYKLTKKEKNVDIAYFNKINQITRNEMLLIEKNRKEVFHIVDYNVVLSKIIEENNVTKEELLEDIQNLCFTKKRNEKFKYIDEPLQFEFYISLLVYLIYGNEYSVNPNYKTDDYGMPISHAPGKTGDIEVLGPGKYWLLEVTLIRNKTQQINNETVNLFRHIDNSKWEEKYMSLIAPVVHEDTVRLYNSLVIEYLIEKRDKFYAKPYDINEFIESCKVKNNFEDMIIYTKKLKEKALTELMKEI